MIESLNNMPDPVACQAFYKCCASLVWARHLSDNRPFISEAKMLEAASELWWNLDESEWLAAFSGHPRIGGIDTLRARFDSTRSWSQNEQSGMESAPEAVLEALAIGNRHYEKKFGFIFIVCATGRTAPELLTLLESRLRNNREVELNTAVSEQEKITMIRLKKLLSETPNT